MLYAGAFPNLAALASSGKPRADLEAVLLTGIPSGIVPGFQNNTGSTLADQLRLNMAIAPAKKPNPGGLAFGDAAGYPNGRRPADDVVTIVLRAVAGLLYPLIDKNYKVDAAVSLVSDGLGPKNSSYLSQLPVPRDAVERLRHEAACGVEMEAAMHTDNHRAQPRRAGAQPRVGHRHPGVERERRARHRGRARRADHLPERALPRTRDRDQPPSDGDAHRVHTGVHERSSDAGSTLTAIFGILAAGQYVVWEDGDQGETVAVPDGRSRKSTSRRMARSPRSTWTDGERDDEHEHDGRRALCPCGAASGDR